MVIKIETKGTTGVQFSRMLGVNIDQMENLTPFYKDSVEIFDKRADDIFKKQGKNLKNAPQWKKLKPATVRFKQSRFWSNRMLDNTGRLKNSRKKVANRRVGELIFTTSYAKYHSTGTKNMPRREIVDIDNKTQFKIEKSLQGHIQKSGWAFRRVL